MNTSRDRKGEEKNYSIASRYVHTSFSLSSKSKESTLRECECSDGSERRMPESHSTVRRDLEFRLKRKGVRRGDRSCGAVPRADVQSGRRHAAAGSQAGLQLDLPLFSAGIACRL